MGKLGTIGQFFNTLRKSPIAGKFLQRGSAASKGRIPKGFAQGVKPGAPGTPVGRAVYPGQPNPITGAAPTRLTGTGGGKSLMNFVAPGQNPLGRAWGFSGRALNAAGLYEGARRLTQGDVGGAAASLTGSFPGRTLGLASNLLRGSVLGFVPRPLIGAAALIALTPGEAGGSMDALTPEQRKALDAETRSQQENMSAAQKRRMGITPAETDVMYGTIPPSVNDDLPGQNYDPSVTLPGAPTAPYVPATTLTPDPVPTTPTPDIGQAMDPYAYQLNVYGQGRQDAATQSSQAAVRDLGLSIHRQLHPNLYKNDGPKTPLQEPSTMNNLDAVSELDASTRAVEELIDPTILAQLNAMNLRRSGY